MSQTYRVGRFQVTALDDGESHLPPSAYPGADPHDYPEIADSDGTIPIRVGAHLVTGPAGAFLVDAGAGRRTVPFPPEMAAADGLVHAPGDLMRAGDLPAALAAAGVRPEEITHVLLTHLHLDHVGWVVADGAPFFPHAVVHYGAGDWKELVEGADPADPVRDIMLTAERAGVLRPYEDRPQEVLPGVRVVPVPGHTPGSVVVELESEGERLWFTGDLFQHPGQSRRDDIAFMTDVDRAAAARARAEVVRRAAADGIVLATAHLPNPVFRRLTPDGSWEDASRG